VLARTPHASATVAAMARLRYSPGEHVALIALAHTGSLKDAQALLGIGPSAMKHRLASARARNGGLTNLQLCYLLGQESAGREVRPP
jgi:hypothetical protein